MSCVEFSECHPIAINTNVPSCGEVGLSLLCFIYKYLNKSNTIGLNAKLMYEVFIFVSSFICFIYFWIEYFRHYTSFALSTEVNSIMYRFKLQKEGECYFTLSMKDRCWYMLCFLWYQTNIHLNNYLFMSQKDVSTENIPMIP